MLLSSELYEPGTFSAEIDCLDPPLVLNQRS